MRQEVHNSLRVAYCYHTQVPIRLNTSYLYKQLLGDNPKSIIIMFSNYIILSGKLEPRPKCSCSCSFASRVIYICYGIYMFRERKAQSSIWLAYVMCFHGNSDLLVNLWLSPCCSLVEKKVEVCSFLVEQTNYFYYLFIIFIIYMAVGSTN